MREIKFRGWKVDLNTMFSAEQMAADQMCILPTGNFINVHQAPMLSTIYAHSNFIPMQFTGLHDKNGNEIYEGDILRYSQYVDHGQWGETVDGGTVQVTWLEERAAFYPFCIWSSYNDQLKSCEIIGNIYKNPELLK